MKFVYLYTFIIQYYKFYFVFKYPNVGTKSFHISGNHTTISIYGIIDKENKNKKLLSNIKNIY